MCGCYRLSGAGQVAEFLGAESTAETSPALQHRPSEQVPVHPSSRVRTRRRPGQLGLRCLLGQRYFRRLQVDQRPYERVLEEPAFRDFFAESVDWLRLMGFYEWKKVDRLKRAFHFLMKGEAVSAFADLWDRWRSSERHDRGIVHDSEDHSQWVTAGRPRPHAGHSSLQPLRNLVGDRKSKVEGITATL